MRGLKYHWSGLTTNLITWIKTYRGTKIFSNLPSSSSTIMFRLSCQLRARKTSIGARWARRWTVLSAIASLILQLLYLIAQEESFLRSMNSWVMLFLQILVKGRSTTWMIRFLMFPRQIPRVVIVRMPSLRIWIRFRETLRKISCLQAGWARWKCHLCIPSVS